ncbi:MAG: DMT family transporter [Chloroflexota bacterium]
MRRDGRWSAEVGGVGLALVACLLWGGQFPVAKAILPNLGALYLTAIRYAFISVIFVAALLLFEGRKALRYEGRFPQAAILGVLGFTSFNLLAFGGLAHTRPENAALISATMPLQTALILWVWRRTKPPRAALLCMLAALCGVGLVISRGQWSFLTSGKVGYGDLMVVAAYLGWVLYTMFVRHFTGWSPLRFTALTVLPGAAVVLLIAAGAAVTGAARIPSLTQVGDSWWQLLYMIVGSGIISVLSWNASVQRLGAQNAILFMNLVPVITLVIEIAQGNGVHGAELAGAALTIGALVVNNLLGRRGKGSAASLEGMVQPGSLETRMETI